MSEPVEAVESGEVLEVAKDLKVGRRNRRAWRRLLAEAAARGYSESQVRGFVTAGGLFADDAARKEIAGTLGFDWEGAAEFFAAITPMIIEMMGACSAL